MLLFIVRAFERRCTIVGRILRCARSYRPDVHHKAVSLDIQNVLVVRVVSRDIPDGFDLAQGSQHRRVHVETGTEHQQQIAQRHFRLFALFGSCLDQIHNGVQQVAIFLRECSDETFQCICQRFRRRTHASEGWHGKRRK